MSDRLDQGASPEASDRQDPGLLRRKRGSLHLLHGLLHVLPHPHRHLGNRPGLKMAATRKVLMRKVLLLESPKSPLNVRLILA